MQRVAKATQKAHRPAVRKLHVHEHAVPWLLDSSSRLGERRCRVDGDAFNRLDQPLESASRRVVVFDDKNPRGHQPHPWQIVGQALPSTTNATRKIKCFITT